MDIETQKELDCLNSELQMRMKKEYGDGAVLVSFSLIYFITVVDILLNLVDFSNCTLIKICIFSMLSIIFFLFPILIYYATATRNRENLSALLSIASYKKGFSKIMPWLMVYF